MLYALEQTHVTVVENRSTGQGGTAVSSHTLRGLLRMYEAWNVVSPTNLTSKRSGIWTSASPRLLCQTNKEALTVRPFSSFRVLCDRFFGQRTVGCRAERSNHRGCVGPSDGIIACHTTCTLRREYYTPLAVEMFSSTNRCPQT